MIRLFAFLLTLVSSTASIAEIKVIHAGSLLAVPGEEVLDNQTVVIKNGMVAEVVDGFANVTDYGEDAELVDLKNKFVLPEIGRAHV